MKTRQFLGFLLLFVLLFTLVGGGLFFFISRQIQQIEQKTIAPIQEVNHAMATRVAKFLEPTPTIIPDPVSIIHEIRSLARLETIQYSVEKVISADAGREDLNALFGDKLLFVAHGEVIAGIDLQKIQLEDVKLDGKAVTIKLPATEILSTRLDNDKSYVYDRQTGILTRQDAELETKARQVAEQQIYQTALDDGILNQAQTNAEAYLDRLIRSLGYSEVIFSSFETGK